MFFIRSDTNFYDLSLWAVRENKGGGVDGGNSGMKPSFFLESLEYQGMSDWTVAKSRDYYGLLRIKLCAAQERLGHGHCCISCLPLPVKFQFGRSR